jgi:hypothetical protein
VGCLEIYTRQIAESLRSLKDFSRCFFSDGPSFLEFWKREDHKFGLNYGLKFFVADCRKTPNIAALYCDRNQAGLLNRNNLVGSSKEFAE